MTDDENQPNGPQRPLPGFEFTGGPESAVFPPIAPPVPPPPSSLPEAQQYPPYAPHGHGMQMPAPGAGLPALPPISGQPQSPSQGGTGRALIVFGVVAGLVAVIAVGAFALVGLLGGLVQEARPPVVSTPPAISQSPSEAAAIPSAAPSSSPSASAVEPSSSASAPVEESSMTVAEVEQYLEQLTDEYKHGRQDGSLWSKIPDNDFNRTAVSAFVYLVTDLKLALMWGATQETANEYVMLAEEYETRLLNQEPLGSSVTIRLSENRVFRCDGDTGEGGYSTE